MQRVTKIARLIVLRVGTRLARMRKFNQRFSSRSLIACTAGFSAVFALSACAQDDGVPSSDITPADLVDENEQALLGPPTSSDPAQKFANLGTCELESGESIRNCYLGYRTYGTLNAARDNAVLWPTWFTGQTKDLVGLVPDRFVDTSKFYLILVDALGDGVTTSPSNGFPTQRRLRFPKFNVRDMVHSQHRLLTENLGIDHLHAVAGISMGGMQAIEWSVTYPDFADKIVSMVGSPQLTSQDLLLWHTSLNALDSDIKYLGGYYVGRPKLKTVVDVLQLALFTAEYRSANTTRADFPAWIAGEEAGATFDWNDWHRQLEAMIAHDVAAPYGGSLAAAAARVTAESLYMVAAQDQVVNPKPAQDFGVLAGATVQVTESNCGHLAVQVCETDQAAATVSAFLSN